MNASSLYVGLPAIDRDTATPTLPRCLRFRLLVGEFYWSYTYVQIKKR